MIAVLSLLLVLILSMIVTRIGAVALVLTGMSDDTARFQARSALTGAGFTTSESEQILTHPVRRRIIALLMLLGNVGIVAASGTLIISLLGIEKETDILRLVVLVGGVLILFAFSRSKAVDRVMRRVITWALARYTNLETRDYATLLQLRGDYRIAELLVEPEDWMVGKSLAEMHLRGDLGVLVLGVMMPDGRYEGAPGGEFVVEADQVLVVYGLPDAVDELDRRRHDQDEASGDV